MARKLFRTNYNYIKTQKTCQDIKYVLTRFGYHLFFFALWRLFITKNAEPDAKSPTAATMAMYSGNRGLLKNPELPAPGSNSVESGRMSGEGSKTLSLSSSAGEDSMTLSLSVTLSVSVGVCVSGTNVYFGLVLTMDV